MNQSLYIHIPFCREKCAYCDFYSVKYCRDIAAAYIDILCRQINSLAGDFSTIYIGGGTPTVLGKTLLEKLLNSLNKISKNAVEFTVEANPESIDKEKLKLLRSYGVNRISIGAQSLRDEKLHKLGRIHSAKKAIEALSLAKREGFKNISIDLIFGVWQETLKDWREELKRTCDWGVKHISAYSLTYEKRTPLFKKLKNKEIYPLSDEKTSLMYEYAMAYLPKRGFLQYEISNFAQKSFECRHNMNYWRNGNYLGLGASAVSYCGGVRRKNTSDVIKYITKVTRGLSPISFKEKLSPRNSAKETAALKIRTKEGLGFRWFKEKTGFNFMDLEKNAVAGLVRQHFLKYIRNNSQVNGVCLTQKGFLFCDSVCSELL